MALKRFPQVEPARGLREIDDVVTALRLDGTTNELLVKQGTSIVNVLDFLRQKLQAGKAFFAGYGGPIADVGGFDILLVTPNTDIRVHLLLEVEAAGAAVFQVYEGVAATAGTAVPAYNRDRNSAATATMTLSHTPTEVTGDDTAMMAGLVGTGAPYKSAQEIILKKNTKYLITVANMAGAANNILARLSWLEL